MLVIIYTYIGFIMLYRMAELYAFSLTKSGIRPPRHTGEKSRYLITIPYMFGLLMPALEFMYLQLTTGYLHLFIGGILFLLGAIIRFKGRLDLGAGFSMDIEKKEGQQLVTTGIYKHIRHPLYLGNLLVLVACPLFLNAKFSWIFSVLGFFGILIRIKLEEQFMLQQFGGYAAYCKRTTRLIPKIF